MKKQHIVVAIVAAVVTCLGTSASADMYFEDMIDTTSEWEDRAGPGLTVVPPLFGPPTDASATVFEGTDGTYTHMIDSFAIPDEYLVTEAHLELDFTNDMTDSYNLDWSFSWPNVEGPYDTREYVRLAYDGSGWIDIGEQDNGQYTHDLYLDLGLLNDDGSLDVSVQAYNYVDGLFNTATLSLDHSKLYGNVQAVPVPGAVLLGMLGFGAAGLKLRKFV